MHNIYVWLGIILPAFTVILKFLQLKNSIVTINLAIYLGYLICSDILPVYLIGLGGAYYALIKFASKKIWVDLFVILISLIFYFCLHSHIFPGVKNILLAKNIILSKQSIPWSFYINHDKALIIFLAILNNYNIYREKRAKYFTILSIIFISVLCITSLSLILGFVQYDFKISNILWIWSANNLLMVCLGEEVFFRLFLYNKFYNLNIFKKYKKIYALLLSSLFFGLFHYSGGYLYMFLAFIAGVMYCLLYIFSGNLAVSVIGHFMLNLVHFIFFSYPRALQ